MASIKIIKRDIKGTSDCKVFVAYYHDHFNTRFNTGVRISRENWDEKKSLVSRKQKGYSTLNNTILAIKNKIETIRQKQISTDGSLSVTEISSLYKKPEKPNNKKSMVDLWAAYLASIKDTVEPRTFNSYSNSFETTTEGKKLKNRKGINFREFLKSKSWETITPDKFTATHFNLYHGYLKTKVKPNTAAKRLKHFKQFCTHITDDLKLPLGFDHEKVKYKETSGLKISLSETELTAYIEADLPDHLVKVRDLAVIQCNTGLRISDRKRIDKNIKGNKIAIEAQKTRSAMEIPISPQVRAILEKYNYDLPQLSEQNYRQGIKDIHKKLFPEQTVQVRDGRGFKDVFVWGEISSHDMVRTFITLSAERGMAISSIAKITGKSVATLLKNYLVESQKTADQEMEKAWGTAPLKISR